MPIIKGLEWTFDTVASAYEKWRPGYPDELYRMLFAYIPIAQSSHAVEVGIGGGQATLPVLETGCGLTAVECGEQCSKLCEKKFGEYKNFSVITGRFENLSFPHGSTIAKFLKNPLAFSGNNRYNTTCCDMIAVKREVAAERRVFPWSECQEAGTLPGQET